MPSPTTPKKALTQSSIPDSFPIKRKKKPSHFTKKLKKFARYSLTALLLTGMVFVTGFLSFSGFLVLNGSIYLASAAFILGGGVEGEVYAQNINKSLLKLFTAGYWEEVVIENLLDRLFEIQNQHQSDFLQEYKDLQDYVQQLKEDLEHCHNPDTKKTLKKNIRTARKSLKEKKIYFRKFILENDETRDRDFDDELQKAMLFLLDPKEEIKGDQEKTTLIKQEKTRLQQKIRSNIFYSRLAWILNLGAGISCGLVGIEVAQSSIAILVSYFGISISATVLSASIFGLAMVGAIGYMLLIHNTITDMIKDETLKTWAAKIRDFFKYKTDENGQVVEKTTGYLLRVIPGLIAVIILVGLGVFATIATAGTWWYAAKAGAQWLPWVSRFASELRAIAVSIMGITTLVFSIKNSLESAEEFIKISLQKSWDNIKNTILLYKAKENWAQFLNPFRLLIILITIPFRFVVFVGHTLSVGLMGDKLDNVDPQATAVLSGVNEWCQDFHYFTPEDNKKHGDHVHVDLVGKFLKLALVPLYFVAAAWDYFCSWFNGKDDKDKPQLDSAEAWHKSLDGLHEEPKERAYPELSEKWKAYAHRKNPNFTRETLEKLQENSPTTAVNDSEAESKAANNSKQEGHQSRRNSQSVFFSPEPSVPDSDDSGYDSDDSTLSAAHP